MTTRQIETENGKRKTVLLQGFNLLGSGSWQRLILRTKRGLASEIDKRHRGWNYRDETGFSNGFCGIVRNWRDCAENRDEFGYDETTDCVFQIAPNTDIGNVSVSVEELATPSRQIRDSQVLSFDRIGFLLRSLAMLRAMTSPQRADFQSVVNELADGDFLESLRGKRGRALYRRFRVQKRIRKAWQWNPSRRGQYLAKVENCRNGQFVDKNGNVRQFEPMEIHTREDACPVILRSLEWCNIPYKIIPFLDKDGNEQYGKNGKLRMTTTRHVNRGYRQLSGQISKFWSKLEECGVSFSERDDFRTECEQTAVEHELTNRKVGQRPVFNSFLTAVERVYIQFLRRHQLRDVSSCDDTQFATERCADTLAATNWNKLDSTSKALAYLVHNGWSLNELVLAKTITRRTATQTAKKFRELAIL